MTETALADQIIRPEDCVIGFGIPVTGAAFRQARRDPRRDFVRQFTSLNQYTAHFLASARRNCNKLEDLGVTLVPETTLDRFAALFRQDFKVIVLFSHWSVHTVEFADGMAPVSAIIKSVPESFVGIIDLCVCRSRALQQALYRDRPNCLVRHVEGNQQVTAWLWPHFYYHLMWLLSRERLPYIDALKRTVRDFRGDVHEPTG